MKSLTKNFKLDSINSLTEDMYQTDLSKNETRFNRHIQNSVLNMLKISSPWWRSLALPKIVILTFPQFPVSFITHYLILATNGALAQQPRVSFSSSPLCSVLLVSSFSHCSSHLCLHDRLPGYPYQFSVHKLSAIATNRMTPKVFVVLIIRAEGKHFFFFLIHSVLVVAKVWILQQMDH